MSAPTKLIPAQLIADLSGTLARLRMSRMVGDHAEERVSEARLNWLLEKLPRNESRATQCHVKTSPNS